VPELPELEIVREVLQSRVVGRHIACVELVQPAAALVIRDLLGRGFAETLTGAQVKRVERRGKFLILETSRPGGDVAPPATFLVINPKLTGRLQLASSADKRHKKTAFVFSLSDGAELRYYDDKTMGQLYLTADPLRIPEFAGMGPEPFDLSLDEFRQRLRPYRGEIKGILTRGDFVAGIGNAYADEILWHARLHPFRKRTQLSSDERCGTPISEISANQRITNFCRTCQPGGLIRGM
jgi:formamidopyrimidine-DNA glycosylase